VADLVPEDDFYIICVDASGEFWIFPSRVFAENATESERTYDLNLDSRGRGEKLKDCKNAWQLLKTTHRLGARSTMTPRRPKMV